MAIVAKTETENDEVREVRRPMPRGLMGPLLAALIVAGATVNYGSQERMSGGPTPATEPRKIDRNPLGLAKNETKVRASRKGRRL